MPPLISILLPVWNAAAILPACLRSLQRQTEQRWHCVLVDDGSDDGSLGCRLRRWCPGAPCDSAGDGAPGVR